MLEAVFGVLLGIFTGLVPGIHPNTVSSIASESLPLSGLALACFLALIYVVNSVTEFIPSVFLSAPSEATSLSLLPGHRMLLQGQGLKAVRLAFKGAALGSLFFLLLLPASILFLKPLLSAASGFMFWILSVIVVNAILKERKVFPAVLVFLSAGALGIFSGRLPLGGDALLFVLLTGGFGVSTLFLSLLGGEEIPRQKKEEGSFGDVRKPAALGTLGGFLVGTLPAVSPSQAIYLLSSAMPASGESFLVALGAVTSTSFLFSLVTLFSTGKGRNGTAVLIGKAMEMDLASLFLLIGVSVGGILLSVWILGIAVKKVVSCLGKVDYFKLNLVVLLFLLLLINFWVGPYGLLLALTSASLGVFCQLSEVKRTNLMGMLLLPTMLFYLGL